MLQQATRLMQCKIAATDGEIGRLHDVYFDDQHWTVRYLVVDTSHWLVGRRVLISPLSVSRADWAAARLELALTKTQIKNSPDIDTDRPVARREEVALAAYFGLPSYRTGPYGWSPRPSPADVGMAEAATAPARAVPHGGGEWRRVDPHLRSIREVTSYHIQALDAEVGHVEDFLIADGSWIIRYAVVDTRNWWPGKKVLISPGWIAWVSWGEKRVHVSLRRHTIRMAPEYDPSRPLDREDEIRLCGYYGRPKYWERETGVA